MAVFAVAADQPESSKAAVSNPLGYWRASMFSTGAT